MPIQGKIDVTKIDKEHLFVGAKGKYCDFALVEKPNDFGDDGFIAQKVSKTAYEAGVKGPIIGNWRHVGSKAPAKAQPKPATRPAQSQDDDDIPF